MAESLTIARPYADAAFKRAVETNGLAAWSAAIAQLAAVTQTAEARQLIADPALDSGRIADAIADVARLDGEPRNFVKLLAQNDRLSVLPEIASQFEVLKSRHEQVLDVEVQSAFALTEKQVSDIVATLETRYGRKIKATTTVDPELIGGVAIRVGDEVIDASVRGKLAQLAATLSN
ncbi:MAG: F0F1 ATP synthase subunit delta [Lautropia sp.]